MKRSRNKTSIISPGAIGVFDSGVGGLTVARAIRRFLPAESILYFGDTMHVPYGNKSPETILRYSRDNTDFLVKCGVKMVVVACNTSTAVALKDLQKEYSVPIVGVIEPGASEAVRVSTRGRISVIGTFRTVSSGAYQRAIHLLDKNAKVASRACPLLVPLIEEGFQDKAVIEGVLKNYLGKIVSGADTLVLGCTHYPLIKSRIQKLYPKLRLVDSADATAREVARLLGPRNATSSKTGKIAICTNDINEVFVSISKRLFPGESIRFAQVG